MENQRKPVCVIGLVIINVIVFLLLSMGGMTEDGAYMVEHGAMYVPYIILKKEYYRIFTCMFLHFGFQHLMNNMLTLVILGKYLEPIVGKVKFVIIYMLSGIGGSVLTLLVELKTDVYHISAGASGAIFGLTGALLSLTILNRGQIAGLTKQGVLIMIGISLYNGFASGNVANSAHIGGLIFGFILTCLLCFQRYAKRCADSNF